ncbi:hypothetical protein T4E_1530 [Trichinella pseudospiralis]|uniref:SCAN domain-containing protein 3 n=1 Tax=Trichinella pseudospiralis TaxID=6337 RepID=A0A0V0XMP6_TRIPS|nr:hypothetical protein T4E_1530 [Trichinella pseudospiralis]
MLDCHRGFIALLKKSVPDVLAMHCAIHRQHLTAKHLTESLASLFRICDYGKAILKVFKNKELLLRDRLKKFKSTRPVISSFASKLGLFKRNFERGEFYQFPSVAIGKENKEVHDDDIQISTYSQYEDSNWVIDPFSSIDEREMELQEELIELQTNEVLKLKFKNGYHSF